MFYMKEILYCLFLTQSIALKTTLWVEHVQNLVHM